MPTKARTSRPSKHASAASGKKARSAKQPTGAQKVARLYSLNVYLADWSWKPERSLWRTIQIRGDQTLHDLHNAIFDAFDRDDEHLYEFTFSRRRRAPGTRYVHPYALEGGGGWGSWDNEPDQDASQTTLDSLALRLRKHFFYLFDFGDDWRHTIEVLAIGDAPPQGRFPKIVDRKGESPPQYPDIDQE